MDSDARGEGDGRRVEEGGNRYQTISADHHNIGGSTAAWLVERRDLASGIIVSPINRINGTDNLPAAIGPDVVGARASRSHLTTNYHRSNPSPSDPM